MPPVTTKVFRGSVTRSANQKPWTAHNSVGRTLGSEFDLRKAQQRVEALIGGLRVFWERSDLSSGSENYNAYTPGSTD
jgi:hypothetical protein